MSNKKLAKNSTIHKSIDQEKYESNNQNLGKS